MSENKNLGQEPAFPNESNAYMQMPDCFGMSKRFYAACVAMQGLLSNSSTRIDNMTSLIMVSYEYADELLKQENIQ